MRTRLVETRDLAPDVRHFLFEVPELARLGFTAGQFVSFSGVVAEKKITRAYSIASPPGADNRFELCLNRVKEGVFSPRLFELQPGDEVEMRGPLGAFVLREPVSDSVFIATGTGIAPIRAMIKDVLPRDGERRFLLIFGVRNEENLLYRDDFESLARRHANFEFRPVLSRPESSWQGRTGRVQAHMLEAIGGRRDLDVYLCGLRDMVDDVRERLKNLGFDRRRLVYERYD